MTTPPRIPSLWSAVVTAAAVASLALLGVLWAQHVRWTTDWRSVFAAMRTFGDDCDAATGVWQNGDTFDSVQQKPLTYAPMALPYRGRPDAPTVPEGGYLVVRCNADLSVLRQAGFAWLRVGTVAGDSAVYLNGRLRQTLDDNKLSEFPLAPADRVKDARLVIVSKKPTVPGFFTGPASLVRPMITDTRADVKLAGRFSELFAVEVPVFRIGYAASLVLVFAVIWLAGLRAASVAWMSLLLLTLTLDNWVWYQPLEDASRRGYALHYCFQFLTPFAAAGFLQAFLDLGPRWRRVFERALLGLLAVVALTLTVAFEAASPFLGQGFVFAAWGAGAGVLGLVAGAGLWRSRGPMQRLIACTGLAGAACYALNIPLMTATGISFVPYVDFALATLLAVELGLGLAALQKAHAAAREELALQTAVARTAQMLAHDARKPFRILAGTLATLAAESDPDRLRAKASRYLGNVKRALDDVEDLVEDVLELGRERPLAPEAVDPAALLLDGMRRTFAGRGGHDVALRFDLRHTRAVLAEPARMQRVITNIVQNAVEAMSGSGEMWLETHDAVEEGKASVRLAVGNSNSRIAAEDLPHLFKAFYTKGKRAGTGLGLAIADKLVRLHGGRIWAESDANSVVFWLSLPAAAAGALPPREALPRHSTDVSAPDGSALIAAAEAVETSDLVAVVDDDVFMREAWQASLTDATVVCFEKPEAFLAWLDADPDRLAGLACIVLDFHFETFSAYDGESLARELRLRSEAVPLVLASDSSARGLTVRALFAAVMPKTPEPWAELRRRLSAGSPSDREHPAGRRRGS